MSFKLQKIRVKNIVERGMGKIWFAYSHNRGAVKLYPGRAIKVAQGNMVNMQ